MESKFRKIENAVIRGIPQYIFEKAKKDKLNITLLFFNTNSEFIEENFNALDELISVDIKFENEKIKKFDIIKDKTENKPRYIG